jgi:hypothetical protein
MHFCSNRVFPSNNFAFSALKAFGKISIPAAATEHRKVRTLFLLNLFMAFLLEFSIMGISSPDNKVAGTHAFVK